MIVRSCTFTVIMKTSLCDIHILLLKVVKKSVYLYIYIFLIIAKNIDIVYMLEPPRPAYPIFATKWGPRGYTLHAQVFMMLHVCGIYFSKA